MPRRGAARTKPARLPDFRGFFASTEKFPARVTCRATGETGQSQKYFRQKYFQPRSGVRIRKGAKEKEKDLLVNGSKEVWANHAESQSQLETQVFPAKRQPAGSSVRMGDRHLPISEARGRLAIQH